MRIPHQYIYQWRKVQEGKQDSPKETGTLAKEAGSNIYHIIIHNEAEQAGGKMLAVSLLL